MRYKLNKLTSFSRSMQAMSYCYRAESENDLILIARKHALARGAGLSYNDSSFLTEGAVVDCKRLTHLLDFDPETGLLQCQAGTPLMDLCHIHPDYIPAVIPGTSHATVGGAIAHDVHGKNNATDKTFGHHINELTLQTALGEKKLSAKENTALFYATLGGLGLTGIIKTVTLTLKKAPAKVEVHCQKHTDLPALLFALKTKTQDSDYQVAWLDLLHHTPRGVLQWANTTASEAPASRSAFSLPQIPLRLMNRFSARAINHFYFHRVRQTPQILPLLQFNNPLDSIGGWNQVYGKAGLIQFQACLPDQGKQQSVLRLLDIIRESDALPTLCVVKYFQHEGAGLLSFVKKGFTLAVDFVYDAKACALIRQLNHLTTQWGGRVYLAKDQLLTKEQFAIQYPQHEAFQTLLQHHHCQIRSDLSQRLGITYE